MRHGSFITHDTSIHDISAYISRPRLPDKSSVGLKILDQSNDVFYDTSRISFSDKVLISDSNLSGFTTHTLSSNSAYAFAIGQLLLTRNIIDDVPISITSSSSAFLIAFRGITGDQDVINDYRLNVGQIGIITLKKILYGDFIRAVSFTANTNNGFMFKDASSGSQWHGILVKTVTGDNSWTGSTSAGIIFYDYGIAAIFGDNLDSVNSISSLSSVNYSSSYDINTLSVICTAGQNELNAPTNDTAFYNSSVTADPNNSASFATMDFTASGFTWGTESSTALHSKYYLYGMKDRQPYITTVGLYNDNNDLLLIAKLTQPIKKPASMPISIKVNIDF